MSDFEIRKARPDDEVAVTELSSHIWEGEDYVPRRFADWLADPYGQFTVVYEDDQLVGFSKLTRLASDEWWLEGLRVHPAYRNRGIARFLHRYAVDLAERIGSGMLRFATSAKNAPVHKLAYETGFHLIHPFLGSATATPATTILGHFKRVTAEEQNELDNWLRQSPQLAAIGGLYEERWKWQDLSPQLERLIHEERVYWWGKEQEFRLGVVVLNSRDDDIMWVNYLDGVAGTLTEILTDVRVLAHSCNVAQLKLKPPATDEWQVALNTTGWQIEPDFELLVFGRELVLPA